MGFQFLCASENRERDLVEAANSRQSVNWPNPHWLQSEEKEPGEHRTGQIPRGKRILESPTCLKGGSRLHWSWVRRRLDTEKREVDKVGPLPKETRQEVRLFAVAVVTLLAEEVESSALCKEEVITTMKHLGYTHRT